MRTENVQYFTDKEWSQGSNVAIANACQVSEHFVRSLRNLSSPGAKIPKERKVKRKGTTFTVNTENIGNSLTTSKQRDDDAVMHQDLIPEPITQTTPSPVPIQEEPKGIPLTEPVAPDKSVENPAPSIKNTAVMQDVSVNKPTSNIPGVVVGTCLEKRVVSPDLSGIIFVNRYISPDERTKMFTDLMKCTFPAENQNVIHENMLSGKFGHEMNLLEQVVQLVYCKIWPMTAHSLAGKKITLPEGSVSGSKPETVKNQSR